MVPKMKVQKKRKIKRSKLNNFKGKYKFKGEIKSETSSLKRKTKNPSQTPRNNIEALMQQFLMQKGQNNQNTLIQKYTKKDSNLAAPDFSKEQTKSILNISSQGGAPNMSFINYKILTQDKKPKSKDARTSGNTKIPAEHSPKYTLKKQNE